MKVFLDTIGCRLNQSEIEKYAGQFRSAGHEIVATADEADLVVVNTCAVTSQAASDSRQKIRQAARSGKSRVVVTGCWSTLEPQRALEMAGVVKTVDNPHKDHLVAEILELPAETFDLEPLARQPLPGVHLRTRAFIKVQDGCDNHCTFCITRVARGQGRSVPVHEVLKDIHAALEGGAKEVVLTGVHLGSWGHDFQPRQHLRDLIEEILKKTAVQRLRLSSLEPWDLDEDFFSLWSDPRLCRHLHLPLQSGAADVLRRMARKTTPEIFADLVQSARKFSPDIAITTDVMVGFPGESDELFDESLHFVEQINFAAGHVFNFSPRPGTPAARFPEQVVPSVRKERSAVLRASLAASSARYYRRFVGQELPVLWEAAKGMGPEGWHLEGLTDNYLRVKAVAPSSLWNQLSPVCLLEYNDDCMFGKISNIDNKPSL
jgi:threonylcarbamoyladenosine tRNA methylthiotransferase MtaB